MLALVFSLALLHDRFVCHGFAIASTSFFGFTLQVSLALLDEFSLLASLYWKIMSLELHSAEIAS